MFVFIIVVYNNMDYNIYILYVLVSWLYHISYYKHYHDDSLFATCLPVDHCAIHTMPTVRLVFLTSTTINLNRVSNRRRLIRSKPPVLHPNPPNIPTATPKPPHLHHNLTTTYPNISIHKKIAHKLNIPNHTLQLTQ